MKEESDWEDEQAWMKWCTVILSHHNDRRLVKVDCWCWWHEWIWFSIWCGFGGGGVIKEEVGRARTQRPHIWRKFQFLLSWSISGTIFIWNALVTWSFVANANGIYRRCLDSFGPNNYYYYFHVFVRHTACCAVCHSHIYTMVIASARINERIH